MSRTEAKSHAAPRPDTATPADREDLWKRIEELRFVMLTTHDRDGTLNARPVSTQEVDPDGALWFFVARDGGIAADVTRNPHVNVCVMDVGQDLYVWLRGTAELVDDRAKVEALWSPMARAWFVEGPGDPNLGLLRVEVQRGDYWDVKSSTLVQFFALAKAILTKTPPSKDAGTHKQFTH
jgi:general stress protein 26